MRSKKGFTLIELLAIIVILAVIAVITVPIILNVIENSKKGAAKDSLYGYRDAINKYYVSRLSLDSNFEMVDHIYTVDDNGYLSYVDNSDSSNNILYEVKVSGKIPSNGYVQLEKNIVKNACIGFDDYAVLMVDGSVSDVSKGECISVNEIIAANETALEVGTEYLISSTEGNEKEQTLTIVRTGYYKLEVWGASGADLTSDSKSSKGGYGGYSSGVIRLTAGTVLFINVGEQGIVNSSDTTIAGGYNGGGDHTYSYFGAGSSGGGATHIALSSGVLSSFDANNDGVGSANEISNILIVAGGGGSGGIESSYRITDGGHAGGYIGSSSKIYNGTDSTGVGGDQSSNAYFGHGEGGVAWSGAGGGGFYGGRVAAGGGGGSGYIGNSRLLDGVMYCYDCSENGNASTRTISTTGVNKDTTSCPSGYSGDPLTNCAKTGDGYAKITFVGTKYNSLLLAGYIYPFSYVPQGDTKEQFMDIAESGYYKLEVWGASGADMSGDYKYSKGGYGGYSSGVVWFDKNERVYINVGGQGIPNPTTDETRVAGGYNGGGYNISNYWGSGCSGGGATHLALSSGLLSSFDTNNDGVGSADEISNILIVAGGGGSGGLETNYRYTDGGSGGGYVGVSSKIYNGVDPTAQGGTQTTGSYFGKAAGGSGWDGAGGGGFYGGRVAAGGGGGSGYIGNSRLLDGVMYCYDCSEIGDAGIRTISTTGSNKDSANCPDSYSNSALINCSKSGNGYARLTYLGKNYTP